MQLMTKICVMYARMICRFISVKSCVLVKSYFLLTFTLSYPEISVQHNCFSWIYPEVTLSTPAITPN